MKKWIMYAIPVPLRSKIQKIRGKSLYKDYIENKRVIFIHIPKTAGTSIGQLLYGTGVPGHYRAWEYLWESPRKFSEYISFAMVRNPYDRVVSAFDYLKEGGKSQADKIWANENLSDFDDISSFIQNGLGSAHILSWVHFVPQYRFVYDSRGRLLVDYLFKVEEFYKLNSELGPKIDVDFSKLQKLNSTSCKKSVLTRRDKEIINSIYQKDFELFGYENST